MKRDPSELRHRLSIPGQTTGSNKKKKEINIPYCGFRSADGPLRRSERKWISVSTSPEIRRSCGT